MRFIQIVGLSPLLLAAMAHATALSDAASSLSAGQWVRCTACESGLATGSTGKPQSILDFKASFDQGGDDSILSYASTMHWDSAGKALLFYGGAHNSTRRMIRYSDQTSTWSIVGDANPTCDRLVADGWGTSSKYPCGANRWTSSWWPGASWLGWYEYGHQYSSSAVNGSATGGQTGTGREFYTMRGCSVGYYRVDTGAFGDFSSSVASPYGACLYGGAGGLVFHEARNEVVMANGIVGLQSYSFQTGTWTVRKQGGAAAAGNLGSGDVSVGYSRRKKVAVFGGGGALQPGWDSSSRHVWKYDENGAVVPLTDAPRDMRVSFIPSLVAEDPATGNFIVFFPDLAWYVLNPDGVGTWTQQSSAPEPLIFSVGKQNTSGQQYSTENMVIESIPEYNVIVVLTHVNRTATPQVLLYRHGDSPVGPPVDSAPSPHDAAVPPVDSAPGPHDAAVPPVEGGGAAADRAVGGDLGGRRDGLLHATDGGRVDSLAGRIGDAETSGPSGMLNGGCSCTLAGMGVADATGAAWGHLFLVVALIGAAAAKGRASPPTRHRDA